MCITLRQPLLSFNFALYKSSVLFNTIYGNLFMNAITRKEETTHSIVFRRISSFWRVAFLNKSSQTSVMDKKVANRKEGDEKFSLGSLRCSGAECGEEEEKSKFETASSFELRSRALWSSTTFAFIYVSNAPRRHHIFSVLLCLNVFTVDAANFE